MRERREVSTLGDQGGKLGKSREEMGDPRFALAFQGKATTESCLAHCGHNWVKTPVGASVHSSTRDG